MNVKLSKIIGVYSVLLFCACLFFRINVYGKDAEGNIVVVIDPGHGGINGGSDDGAINGEILERNINMSVANAMFDELTKYEGVKVYRTHNSSEESMTLRDRAEYAESLGADFLFSIHFNASETHLLYGSEVWIPSIGNYYVAGRQFANIELDELKDIGTFTRGIKTRIGDNDDEYYGIIRECEWRNINAVIIEHCYMDNSADTYFMDTEEALCRLGRADATAAAKYFGLKSTALGVDYNAFEKESVEPPTKRVYQDSTPPEICGVTVLKASRGNLEFAITASDSDTYINYYAYSLDGGKSYSDLLEWMDFDNDGKMNVILSNNDISSGNLVVKVYNKYDISSESNTVKFNIEHKKDNSRKSILDRIEMLINKNKNAMAAIVLIMCGIYATILIIKRKKH